MHRAKAFLNQSGRSGKIATLGADRGATSVAAVVTGETTTIPDAPCSPEPSLRGAEAHLLVLAGNSIETNLCAIVAGRATREERSLDPTGGTKAAKSGCSDDEFPVFLGQRKRRADRPFGLVIAS